MAALVIELFLLGLGLLVMHKPELRLGHVLFILSFVFIVVWLCISSRRLQLAHIRQFNLVLTSPSD